MRPFLLAFFLVPVQCADLELPTGAKSLAQSIESDHVRRVLQVERGFHDTRVEDYVRSNCPTSQTRLVAKNFLHVWLECLVSIRGLGFSPWLRAVLSTSKEEIKVKVDETLNFSLQSHELKTKNERKKTYSHPKQCHICQLVALESAANIHMSAGEPYLQRQAQ